jgi:hypothetical protein
MNARLLSAAAAAALLWSSTGSMAQSAAPVPGGRVIVSGAVRLTPSSSLGQSTASLTPGFGQDLYPLFSAAGTLDAHAGAEAGLGYRVSRSFRLLLAGTVAWPVVAVRVEGDAEGAPALEFEGESLVQWSVGGRAEYDLVGLRFAAGRAVPFLTAGFSLLWQAHEGWTGTESGRVLEAGGGLTYVVRSNPASRVSRVAIAADVRLTRVTGGITWNGSARTAPALAVGVATAWGRVRKAA